MALPPSMHFCSTSYSVSDTRQVKGDDDKSLAYAVNSLLKTKSLRGAVCTRSGQFDKVVGYFTGKNLKQHCTSITNQKQALFQVTIFEVVLLCKPQTTA